MRQLYAYDANESTRRLVEERMSTGFTNTRTARGFSIAYHVFARKQWILCSALRHKSCFTLYLMLNRFEIHSTLEISRTALLGCLLALRVFVRLRGRWQKLQKLKAFIYEEGERKTKDFLVLNYIKHQIVASISKHFSYLAIFWYFN